MYILSSHRTAIVLVFLVSACLPARQQGASTPIPPRSIAADNPFLTIEGKETPLGAQPDGSGTVRLVGEAFGDIDGDGHDDAAIVFAADWGGSGTFTYLNVFLGDGKGGWNPVGEVFLGDRVRLDWVRIFGPDVPGPLEDGPSHISLHGSIMTSFHFHGPDQAFSEEPRYYLTRGWRYDADAHAIIEDIQE